MELLVNPLRLGRGVGVFSFLSVRTNVKKKNVQSRERRTSSSCLLLLLFWCALSCDVVSTTHTLIPTTTTTTRRHNTASPCVGFFFPSVGTSLRNLACSLQKVVRRRCVCAVCVGGARRVSCFFPRFNLYRARDVRRLLFGKRESFAYVYMMIALFARA